MSAHARLAPSAAARWLRCPGSVRLAADAPDDAGTYAAEGTAAHEVAALVLEHGATDVGPVAQWRQAADAAGDWAPEQLDDMVEHAEDYSLTCAGIERELTLHGARFPLRLVERRLPSGVSDDCWGTVDCGMVSADSREIAVIDYKYGRGVVVDPDSDQLRLYALGLLDIADLAAGPVTASAVVRLVIVQPRAGGERVREHRTTAGELRQWRADVAIPGALATLRQDAPLVPSEVACRWCPVAGSCAVRARKVLDDFADPERSPEVLSAGELAPVLARLPELESWVRAVREHAHALALSGAVIPGWHLVRGARKRQVVSHADLISRLVEAGCDPGDVTREPQAQTLTVLTRTLRRLDPDVSLDEVAGDALALSDGSLSLVPDDPTDSRSPADRVSEALRDFA